MAGPARTECSPGFSHDPNTTSARSRLQKVLSPGRTARAEIHSPILHPSLQLLDLENGSLLPLEVKSSKTLMFAQQPAPYSEPPPRPKPSLKVP
jgi:hypothetical protein